MVWYGMAWHGMVYKIQQIDDVDLTLCSTQILNQNALSDVLKAVKSSNVNLSRIAARAILTLAHDRAVAAKLTALGQGMVQYGMVWYGMVWLYIAFHKNVSFAQSVQSGMYSLDDKRVLSFDLCMGASKHMDLLAHAAMIAGLRYCSHFISHRTSASPCSMPLTIRFEWVSWVFHHVAVRIWHGMVCVKRNAQIYYCKACDV